MAATPSVACPTKAVLAARLLSGQGNPGCSRSLLGKLSRGRYVRMQRSRRVVQGLGGSLRELHHQLLNTSRATPEGVLQLGSGRLVSVTEVLQLTGTEEQVVWCTVQLVAKSGATHRDGADCPITGCNSDFAWKRHAQFKDNLPRC